MTQHMAKLFSERLSILFIELITYNYNIILKLLFEILFIQHSQSFNMSPVTQSNTQKNEENIQPHSFRKQKLQSMSLNTLMENPGFSQITEKILLHLEYEDLQSFRLVCHS